MEAKTTTIRAIVCRTCLSDHGKCGHRTTFIVTTEQEENLLVIARAALAEALRQP